MKRRGFLAALLAAPVAAVAIRVGLAPKPPELPRFVAVEDTGPIMSNGTVWEEWGGDSAELAEIIRKAFVPKMVTSLYDTSPVLRALMENRV